MKAMPFFLLPTLSLNPQMKQEKSFTHFCAYSPWPLKITVSNILASLISFVIEAGNGI
jgi:hypothetical protein